MNDVAVALVSGRVYMCASASFSITTDRYYEGWPVVASTWERHICLKALFFTRNCLGQLLRSINKTKAMWTSFWNRTSFSRKLLCAHLTCGPCNPNPRYIIYTVLLLPNEMTKYSVIFTTLPHITSTRIPQAETTTAPYILPHFHSLGYNINNTTTQQKNAPGGDVKLHSSTHLSTSIKLTIRTTRHRSRDVIMHATNLSGLLHFLPTIWYRFPPIRVCRHAWKSVIRRQALHHLFGNNAPPFHSPIHTYYYPMHPPTA